MIDILIHFLKKIGVDVTAEDVADILWLSAYLPTTQVEESTAGSEFVSEEETDDHSSMVRESDPSTTIKPDPEITRTDTQPVSKVVLPRDSQKEKKITGISAISVNCPTPPYLTEKRMMIKSLRQFNQKMPSKVYWEFDEIHTVQQIADQRIWDIFTHPKLERRIELDLIIEKTPSMLFWSTVVNEFCHMVESVGVFRKVNFWILNTTALNGKPALYVRSHNSEIDNLRRRPAELANFSGNRIILLISDCISPAWHNGTMNPLLETWSTRSFFSLLHLLPEEMKWRTGLRNAFATRLSGCRQIRRNTELIVQRPYVWPFLKNHKIIGIPTFSLEPLALHAWAELAVGTSRSWHTGYVFPEASMYNELPPEEFPDENDPQAILESFRISSSNEAWDLAVYFSITAPLTLPVMRLIQQSMLPSSNYYHLIEVLMGGILKPLSKITSDTTNAEVLRFDFVDGVRERLGNYLPKDLAYEVLSHTTNFIKKKTHVRITFPALLTMPELIGDIEITPDTEAFAWGSSDMLIRYGGEYARFAEELRNSITKGNHEKFVSRSDEKAVENLIKDNRQQTKLPLDDFNVEIEQEFAIHLKEDGRYPEEGVSPVDSGIALHAYLNYVFETCGRISLITIDRQASDGPLTQVNLDAVYTALLTYTPEEEEKKVGDVPVKLHHVTKSVMIHLNRYKRFVLLGEPGSGKSTFINFVAFCLAGEALGRQEANLDVLTAPLPGKTEQEQNSQPWDHDRLLPVRVILRDLAARGLPPPDEGATVQHFWDFLRGELEPYQLDNVVPIIIKTYQEQGGILLIDGLDEVFEAEKRRTQIKKLVESFAKVYPKCRVLVTSRTYAYQEQNWKLSGFHDAVLAPFSDTQINYFVDHWYAYFSSQKKVDTQNAPGNATLLKNAIHDNNRLLDLARRPLLLTLMASLHAWRNGKLPERRQELYEETVDLLLNRWEGRRVLKDEKGNIIDILPSLTEWLKVPDRTKIRALLERLAFEAHQRQVRISGTADVPEDDLLLGLVRLQQNKDVNSQKLKEFLVNRAGLLVPRGQGVYTFSHRTMQEYLAACHLTRTGYPGKVAHLACHDPLRWREVVLLAGARAGSGAEFALWALVDSLSPEKASEDCPVDRQWGALLAGQMLVESANYQEVEEINQPKLDRIRLRLVHILRTGEPPALERVSAGTVLACLGDPRPELMTIEGMQFCFVQAGEFWYGAGEKAVLKDLPDFWLGQHPVSNAQFAVFVKDWGYGDPRWWKEAQKDHYWSKAGFREGYADEPRCGPFVFVEPFSLPNHPVVGVSWYEALAFTLWLDEFAHRKGWIAEKWHICLPDEQEWEKAAHGGLKLPSQVVRQSLCDGFDLPRVVTLANHSPLREYPWEGDFNPEYANTGETRIGSTSALGCFPQGMGPYGCLDLSGNVWEWQESWFEDGDKKILRGGSWNYYQRSARCSIRYRGYPANGSSDVGFRCALSAAP